MIALLALFLASSLPGPVVGDFDHDGKPDRAEIVREGRDIYFLQITRGGAPLPERVPLHLSPPDYMKVAEATQETPTACGKGAGPRNAPCPHPKIEVAKGDLLMGHAEASEAVVKWTGHDFRLEWLTD